MPDTETGDIIRVIVQHHNSNLGNVYQNVFHYVVLAGDVDDELMVVDLGALMGTCYEALQGKLSGTCVFDYFIVYNVTQDYPVGTFSAMGDYLGGTALGEQIGSTQAGVVVFYTQKKKRFGRKFVPGIALAELDDPDTLSESMMLALEEWGDCMRVLGPGEEGFIFTMGVGSEAGLDFSAVTSIVARPILGVIARRKPGRGI